MSPPDLTLRPQDHLGRAQPTATNRLPPRSPRRRSTVKGTARGLVTPFLASHTTWDELLYCYLCLPNHLGGFQSPRRRPPPSSTTPHPYTSVIFRNTLLPIHRVVAGRLSRVGGGDSRSAGAILGRVLATSGTGRNTGYLSRLMATRDVAGLTRVNPFEVEDHLASGSVRGRTT